MNLFGWQITAQKIPAPQALTGNSRRFEPLFSYSFDGEKNFGELGPIKDLMIDHQALRARSWQMFMESEACQLLFRRYVRWVIGSGLKLQAEPQKVVLASEKIDIDDKFREVFNRLVEERFKVYAGSRIPDYADMRNLHSIASKAVTDAIVGGDVLVVQRLVNNEVKIQLVDGANVVTPSTVISGDGQYRADNGNIIRHGIELDNTGRHIAYYVKTGFTDFERIPARGAKSGALMAWMFYGLEYRLDNVRGLPLIAAVMETAKKMDRYKEATVGSAEERQKIAYAIEHDATSTGENPLQKQLARASGFGAAGDEIPRDQQGQALADKVAATTNKQAFNLPIGAKMGQLVSSNEINFKDFFMSIFDLVCATIEIPPNVAMMKYDDNFSASRAALKDWEHSLLVKRKDFSDNFYQNIYAVWLDVQVLTNKVQAPGYLEAIAARNNMAVAAYRFSRWVGANVPHIDPVKEVMAERLKLGGLAGNFPLTTPEAATEALNGGNSNDNMVQFAREIGEGEKLGISKSEKLPPDQEEDDEKDEGDGKKGKDK